MNTQQTLRHQGRRRGQQLTKSDAAEAVYPTEHSGVLEPQNPPVYDVILEFLNSLNGNWSVGYILCTLGRQILAQEQGYYSDNRIPLAGMSSN